MNKPTVGDKLYFVDTDTDTSDVGSNDFRQPAIKLVQITSVNPTKHPVLRFSYHFDVVKTIIGYSYRTSSHYERSFHDSLDSAVAAARDYIRNQRDGLTAVVDEIDETDKNFSRLLKK